MSFNKGGCTLLMPLSNDFQHLGDEQKLLIIVRYHLQQISMPKGKGAKSISYTTFTCASRPRGKKKTDLRSRPREKNLLGILGRDLHRELLAVLHGGVHHEAAVLAPAQDAWRDKTAQRPQRKKREPLLAGLWGMTTSVIQQKGLPND